MAFNGSGVFAVLATYVAGNTITAAEHNSENTNVKGGLELARLRDGQNSPSADLPMASARHTGCNDATARTNYATAADIQDAKLNYIAASGTNTVTATLAPAISAYVTGAPIWLKQATTNTGAMTINLNSVAAKALKKQNDVAMSAGDIEGGQVYCITYDGTDFQMQSQTATTTNDATLNSIAALGASGKMLYTTGTDTWAESTITAAGRALIDDANAAAQITTLGAQTQGDVLDDLNTLGAASADGEFVVATGAGAFAYESGAVARQSLGGHIQSVYTSTGAVATGTTVMPDDDTIPQNTEGDQYMTLAITPKNTNNKLVIDVVANVGCSLAIDAVAALFQDSTAGALTATSFHFINSSDETQIRLRHVMTAGTTSETTFKVRIGPEVAGTVTLNGAGGARKLGGVLLSSISISEVGS